MPRYFIEVAYKGLAYAGFQVQQNANTIQEEVQKALATYYRKPFELTGASRTDSGVHALQNFFHFDEYQTVPKQRDVYHVNSILPKDIVIRNIWLVADEAHCRFDAVERHYKYYIYQHKDPFLNDRAYYYPYGLEKENLDAIAALLPGITDYTAFSKRNTQVNNFNCTIYSSSWEKQDQQLIYTVSANRFLRGMVRGLVGTMLRSARQPNPVESFLAVAKSQDPSKADFSTPAHGLFLVSVKYPNGPGKPLANP